jgi:hypothetical protein
MPVILFSCTHCDFEQSDVKTWGCREYVLEDGVRIVMPSRLGWCHACNGLVAVEDISVKARQEELEKAQKEFANLSMWAFRMRRILQREIVDLQDILLLQQQREESARCLDCGSTDIDFPSKQPVSEENGSGALFKLNFLHPSCGGTLVAKMSDMRLVLQQTVKRYTPNGEQIECVCSKCRLLQRPNESECQVTGGKAKRLLY